MTDQNKTEIVVILDRSGSMDSIRADMEGGFKRFIEEQRAQPGVCAVSLYQFDDQYDVVYEDKPIAEVPPLSLLPRGWTALLDALGKSVVRVGERLRAKPEHERPGAVIVVVITDGQENKSTEYNRQQVRTLITLQEGTYNWRFMYLGADASAFAEAGSLGIVTAAQYSPSRKGVQNLYAAASASVSSHRSNVRGGNARAALNIDPDLTDDNVKAPNVTPADQS